MFARPRPVFCALLTAACLAAGCSSAPTDEGQAESVCPPEEPDCDRLEEPCVIDEAGEPSGPIGPSASPEGLAEPLTGAGKYVIWPNGRVPYKIDATVGATTKERVLLAMNEWQTKTAQLVRFEKALSTDTAYVQVTQGSPRVSFVGYRAGKVLTLYLRNPEYLTVARHEVGHVLGLNHEHQRKDRLGFIQVKSENVVNTTLCKNQFTVCSDCTLIHDYRINSVMHYRSLRDLGYCRIDNKPVLLAKDGSVIDHEWVITKADLLAIQEMYGAAPDGGTGADAGSKDAGSETGSGGSAGASTGGAAGAAGSTASGGSGGAGGASGGATASGGAGGAGASGGAGGKAGSGSGGTKPGGDGEEDDGGCGCRTTKPSSGGSAWLLLVAALALTRRRRSTG